MGIFKFLKRIVGSVAMSWTWNKVFVTILNLPTVVNSERSPCQNIILNSEIKRRETNIPD